VGSLVHHGPVAGVSGGLTGVAPSGQFRGNFFTVSGGKGRGDLRDPHRRQMGAVRRLWCPDVDEWRRRCMELGGRATRARVERIDARAGTVVWRRCSRAAFIGRGRLAGATEETSRRRRPVELQWRRCFGWGRKWGGEMGSWGDGWAAAPIRFAMGGEGELPGEGEPAAAPGRAPEGRRRSGSLTEWAHLSVRGRRWAD
jgi:hypothetical protein